MGTFHPAGDAAALGRADRDADAQRLAAVLGDVLQRLIQDPATGWGSNDRLRDKWFRILREDNFDVDRQVVLTARGPSYTRAATVPALVNAAQESLGLAPKSVSDEDRALRQALQSLVTLTQRDRAQEQRRHRPRSRRSAEMGATTECPPRRRSGPGLVPAHA